MRDATAAAHHALDHHPLLQRLIGSDLTRELYAESLAAMYRPHARLERLVHQSRHCSESGLGLSARLALLEADLVELGWPAPPVPDVAPDALRGRAAWLGRVYVLEGSRLGGAFIARRVQSSLGPSVPCRFLCAPMGPDDRNALLAMLERALEAPAELERAIAGARAAFADYKDDLDGFDRGRRKMEWCREACG
ncbi:biliverdin-producing heme oxygenase [Alkalisalibacterium limincola]|uniref:biliverdin-producing heme oxygenase n=1 Tax=Alkalisalibacterium limincola TaxID=2699169 RepID=UPI001C9C9510|nr:biliverdin-producing heme oxygenase [Alkalisalibacterium limincola]